MNKIVKNEFRKFFKGKIFIFEILLIVGLCLLGVTAYKDMVDITVNNLPKAQTYSEALKDTLRDLDGAGFAKLFLTDFIYKSYFSFFLIFIVITAVNVFSDDRESGNMKFTILTGVERNTVIIGKLAFMVCSILLTVLFNLVLSLVVGTIFFGAPASAEGVLEVVGITLLAVIPAFAITVFIALLSQIKISSKIIMAAGIVFTFIMGVLDTLAGTARFSPIGSLSVFSENIPAINHQLLTGCVVSAVYIAVGVIAMVIVSSKYEYYE